MFSRHQPNIANLKAEARRHRARKSAQGDPITHSGALELISHRYGFCDWNTAVAQGRSLPKPLGVEAGGKVAGRYMGHRFDANVVAATRTSREQTLVSLDLIEPVDVSASKRFSLPRKRITASIGRDGKSAEHLSSGVPQLELFLEEGVTS